MSSIAFPCICQFCGKRYVAEQLSNCCWSCWRLYKKGKLKEGDKR